MRKSDYLKNKRGTSKYPIPEDRLEDVCKEWNKAGIIPDRWLDTYNNFYDEKPTNTDSPYFKENSITECFDQIRELWEEYANGGVHPTENRWYNPMEISEIAKSLINIVPYDETEDKTKVFYKKNWLFRSLLRNPRHPNFSMHKTSVYTKHHLNTRLIFSELCEQIHALFMLNAVLDRNVKEYIRERQNSKVPVYDRQHPRIWPSGKIVRKINGIYVSPRQWIMDFIPIAGLLIIILIIGGVTGGLVFLMIKGGVIGVLLAILGLIFI